MLVGHDFGAKVAWNAAMMRPDRFVAVFGISVPFIQPGGPSYLDQLRAAGRTDFHMFSQMSPDADDKWSDAATTIPGMLYWTSGQPAEGQRWDPFDPAKGTRRPAPESLERIDASYVEEAVASFCRTGFHRPLNYYRAIDPFFAIASAAFAGAKIRQPSFFLTGKLDGLNSVRNLTAESMREALRDLRGFVVLDGVGHWPQLEAPREVNQALLDFLVGLRL